MSRYKPTQEVHTCGRCMYYNESENSCIWDLPLITHFFQMCPKFRYSDKVMAEVEKERKELLRRFRKYG